MQLSGCPSERAAISVLFWPPMKGTVRQANKMTGVVTMSATIRGGYENISTVCPHCGARNVYNRATDVGHLAPIANGRVNCENAACRAAFDISGDLINPAHELLLLDAHDFIQEKRYIQAVLSATTAYESFFSHYLRVELVYRVSSRDRKTVRNELQWLNAQNACASRRHRAARL